MLVHWTTQVEQDGFGRPLGFYVVQSWPAGVVRHVWVEVVRHRWLPGRWSHVCTVVDPATGKQVNRFSSRFDTCWNWEAHLRKALRLSRRAPVLVAPDLKCWEACSRLWAEYGEEAQGLRLAAG